MTWWVAAKAPATRLDRGHRATPRMRVSEERVWLRGVAAGGVLWSPGLSWCPAAWNPLSLEVGGCAQCGDFPPLGRCGHVRDIVPPLPHCRRVAFLRGFRRVRGMGREYARTLRGGHGACFPYGTIENPYLSLALVLTRSKRPRPLLLSPARAAPPAAIAVWPAFATLAFSPRTTKCPMPQAR